LDQELTIFDHYLLVQADPAKESSAHKYVKENLNILQW